MELFKNVFVVKFFLRALRPDRHRGRRDGNGHLQHRIDSALVDRHAHRAVPDVTGAVREGERPLLLAAQVVELE